MSWAISTNYRKILYNTVIERMLAHGSAAWGLNPTSPMARKPSTLQRCFLLAIPGAYGTTPTAALQDILGMAPLHLQLQFESRLNDERKCLGVGYEVINREQLSTPEPVFKSSNRRTTFCDGAGFRIVIRERISTFQPVEGLRTSLPPEEIEEKATGWRSHPSKHPQPNQISLQDDRTSPTYTGICTDDSKTEQGVGATFYVFEDLIIIYRFSAKLRDDNTVFQAEL
ncbi:hypothetical protein AVEN_67706-1 [Araneus ventricosus]|uniref:Uncharacterized protein n=1 Tax=Araneus ventricosus TaxID=182803 RepID=A0A4Y2I5F1_ARAVE|nr:hypothetical protein AVEN_67706-1 [Araneus ventricosus]